MQIELSGAVQFADKNFVHRTISSLQASDVAQLLAKVATGCNLSQAVDEVKFWLLRVALRPV